MVHNVAEILRDTRVAIDRNGGDGGLLPVSLDTRRLDEGIVSVIEDAARQVANAAPVEMLDNARNLMEEQEGGPSIRWKDGGGTAAGAIVLPSDFMRLVSFRMSDWERPVYDIVTEGSKEYALQSSRFAGLRGTPQKPVVAVVRTQYGLELEFYSCKSQDAEIGSALYLPYPRIDANDGIDVAERCYRAFIYTAAAMTLADIGEAERASQYYDTAKQILV